MREDENDRFDLLLYVQCIVLCTRTKTSQEVDIEIRRYIKA